MKELKPINNIYLKEYDVTVTPYLTDVQILIIGESLLELDGYMERQICLATSVLQFCTDITEDEIKAMDYNLLVSSGLLDKITKNIINLHLVNEYIENQESAVNQLKGLVDTVSTTLDSLVERIPNGDQWGKWGSIIKAKVETFIEEHKNDN